MGVKIIVREASVVPEWTSKGEQGLRSPWNMPWCVKGGVRVEE